MSLKAFLKIIFVSFIISSCSSDEEEITESLVYPSFGPELEVNINDLSFDAMEPFLSPNGNYLFFNNLNDGINTKLYYATKINDSTFNYEGELLGSNQTTTPHLDAVADMDSNGNFYWTSTRNYPSELNNLFHGIFSNGTITAIKRVQGDFNMNIPGWLVMDHGISLDGQFLYFNNARFDDENCLGPCETVLGVAKKVNTTEFKTLSNSTSILRNINDSNYIYYAPCISSDNLELYFTRYLKGEITLVTVFEICVAVRSDSLSEFSIPKVLFSEGIAKLIEAPTLYTNKNTMYYHQKTSDSHKIMMRYRNSL
ncbi:MAG: hypothetical protein ACJART_000752 [Maribacter sp.]|jgi:hypothetical protein